MAKPKADGRHQIGDDAAPDIAAPCPCSSRSASAVFDRAVCILRAAKRSRFRQVAAQIGDQEQRQRADHIDGAPAIGQEIDAGEHQRRQAARRNNTSAVRVPLAQPRAPAATSSAITTKHSISSA